MFLFQTDEELERLKAEYDEVDQKLKRIKLMEFEKEDKLNVSLPERNSHWRCSIKKVLLKFLQNS